MRLFLAINPQPQIKEELSQQLAEFRHEYPYFQWVPENNYHITVSFFGDINPDKKFIRSLEEKTYDIPQLYLYSTSVDLFIHQKIILYLNFRRDKNLEKLVKRITEKKYSPHLTFARYRLPSKQQYFVIKKRIQNLSIDVQFKITKLYLLDSQIENGKPIYKKVASFPLDKGD